MAISTHY